MDEVSVGCVTRNLLRSELVKEERDFGVAKCSVYAADDAKTPRPWTARLEAYI